MDEAFNYLRDTRGWHEGLARATAKAKGICSYCEENLMTSRVGYSSITLDHLLPKSLYPELEEHPNNHVLSCASCNTMKRTWNPIRDGEEALKMLENHREELISRVQESLTEAIEKRYIQWQEVKKYFTS